MILYTEINKVQKELYMEKITKIQPIWDEMSQCHPQANKFEKYFEFPIEINGKNWYIQCIWAKPRLNWNSQVKPSEKLPKIHESKYPIWLMTHFLLTQVIIIQDGCTSFLRNTNIDANTHYVQNKSSVDPMEHLYSTLWLHFLFEEHKYWH